MKFSDLCYQVDQTRQSDYVFCEPSKRDGLDPPVKDVTGPPTALRPEVLPSALPRHK